MRFFIMAMAFIGYAILTLIMQHDLLASVRSPSSHWGELGMTVILDILCAIAMVFLALWLRPKKIRASSE